MVTVTLAPLEMITIEASKWPNLDATLFLDLLNEYYASINRSRISNLDDIHGKHATRGLANRLGFSEGGVVELQQELVELRIFPARLGGYDQQVQDSIIAKIIENVPNQRFSSFYLSPRNPFAEENNKVVAESVQMGDYILQNFSHLDEVGGEHATQRLGNILGFKVQNPKKMRQRLVELRIFSQNLADYSPRTIEKVAEHLIDNIRTQNFSSYYLSNENKYTKGNLMLILASNAVRNYMHENFLHFDEIGWEDIPNKLRKMLGFGKMDIKKMRQKLVDLGLYSQNLTDYNSTVQGMVISNILDRASKPFSSFYLDPSNPYAEINRRIVVSSSKFIDYLSRHGIFHLDDVVGNATNNFARVLGFKRSNPEEMRQRLVQFGIFPQSLANKKYTAGARDRIIEDIISKMGTSASSFYLNPSNPYAEINRRIVASSRQLRDYLASIGIIHLDFNGVRISQNLANLFGISKYNPQELREQLIRLGIFPEELSKYHPIIIRQIVEGINNRGGYSSYLDTSNPYALANSRVVQRSPRMTINKSQYAAAVPSAR